MDCRSLGVADASRHDRTSTFDTRNATTWHLIQIYTSACICKYETLARRMQDWGHMDTDMFSIHGFVSKEQCFFYQEHARSPMTLEEFDEVRMGRHDLCFEPR